MEITETTDQYTQDREGRPSKVTDYKLFFPEYFKPISKPELVFVTDENYMLPSFEIVSGQIVSDIDILREKRSTSSDVEHGIVEVYDAGNYYQTREILTGETGIGFQLIAPLTINDYLHTHSIYEGEDPKSVDLFSAFDLLSLAEKGAERYWLIGKDVAWCLVNFNGQRYYYSAKSACWELAGKKSSTTPYDEALSLLVECAEKCSFRLYKSDDFRNFTLVNK